MRATAKYFWLVVALFLVQILLGATTAHYQVEGQSAYGLPLADYLPYSLTRSWHTQLAVLWIATAWLGTGLFIGPAISGHEPRFQRLGVNFLFICLIVIVVGAFAGQWLAVMQKLGLASNFWFGHQGWEYVDIGRFWQIFLFIGLILWLVLVGRALWPALARRDDTSSIVGLMFLSTVAIGLLYGAGLMWREHTHLSMVEYWRWWVVHLWVEGFFEVFATAVISFLLVKLGLVRARTATVNVLFATIVYMAGGLGCVIAAASAERLSARLGIGPVIVMGLSLTAFAWQAFGLVHGSPSMAAVALGAAMLVFDFGAVLYGINYLALRQAITPDRLMGRMTATMRFCTVACAPFGSLAGGALASAIGLRQTLWVIGVLGLALAIGAMTWSPVRRHRTLPATAAD